MLTALWNALIVNPLLNTLVFIYSIVGNYGVAIIIFTILIKVVTLPFTLQQTKAMRKQAALQPELQALQKKYGKDKEKYAQAQMQLYKERGINPLGGCLPMLIPWPIFVAFYQSITNVMSTQPEQFMELAKHLMPQLAHVVPVREAFLWMNLARPDPLYILPVLAFATTWIQQKMTTMPAADAQSAQMSQTMGLMMPFFTLMITISFASGLGIYWVVFNIAGIIQQYVVAGWGDLAKYMPKSILRRFPGPTATPQLAAATVTRAVESSNGDQAEKTEKAPRPQKVQPVEKPARAEKPEKGMRDFSRDTRGIISYTTVADRQSDDDWVDEDELAPSPAASLPARKGSKKKSGKKNR